MASHKNVMHACTVLKSLLIMMYNIVNLKSLYTYTAISFRIEFKVRWTFTCVAPNVVYTSSVKAVLPVQTFIYVCKGQNTAFSRLGHN